MANLSEVFSVIASAIIGAPVDVSFRPLKASVGGIAQYPAWLGRQIILARGMRGEQLMRAFAHEVGHFAMGHIRPELYDGYRFVRGDSPEPEPSFKSEAARVEYALHEVEADAWADVNLGSIERLVDLGLRLQRGQ